MSGNTEYSSPGYVVIGPWVTGLPMRIRLLLSIHKHFLVGFGEQAWRCGRFLSRLLGWFGYWADDREVFDWFFLF
jgi:hypothetical protein